MSDQDVEAFLEHFGVKGMKWGVRRPRQREDNIPSQYMLQRGEKQKRLKSGQKKAESILDDSLDEQDVLSNPNGKTMVNGKKFSNQLLIGALLGVNALSIYKKRVKSESDEEIFDETLDETEDDE